MTGERTRIPASVDLDHAVEIAPRVWWVGSVLPDDEFQSHVYLVEAGDQSALIDPGSVLTIEETLTKVAEILPLEHIRWLVCHHADPDVCGALPILAERIPRPDLTVVSEWRVFALLDHYGAGLPAYRVEDHDWRLPLDSGRELLFQLTPYLHFPGALVSYDPDTRVLFSADIFGGFVPEPQRLIIDDVDAAFESIRPFHEHYMPSRELLAAGLQRIRQRFPVIDVVAPQHGHVLTGDLVPEMFARLERLECGVLRFAEEDLDLARLVATAETRRQLLQVFATADTSPELFSTMRVLLSSVHPVNRAGVVVEIPGQGWHRLDSSSGIVGTRAEGPATEDHDVLLVDLPGSPPASLALTVGRPDAVDPSFRALLDDVAPALRSAVDRLLHEREEVMLRGRLERQARLDPLTGVLNRRGLAAALPAPPFAVVLVDLDHFKQVNDTFGHEAGDEVLTRVARTITATVRDQDIVARIGGEEFLVVAPSGDLSTGEQAAERIRAAVGALDLDGLTPSGRITLSGGVAALATSAGSIDGTRMEELDAVVAAADRALYAAKAGGRDRIEVAY